MCTMVSLNTSITIVYSTGADKKNPSKSLALVRGIHWWPINSSPKGPVTLKMLPRENVIMTMLCCLSSVINQSLYMMPLRDVKMGAIASQITSLTIVYSTVYSDADQRKHQSSASLAFVRVIHRWPVNYPHKWPVTRKMFPLDDVIMQLCDTYSYQQRSCRGDSLGLHTSNRTQIACPPPPSKI